MNCIAIFLRFKLIECSSNQFTCTDGECVAGNARCNNIRECKDGSDETNCGKEKLIWNIFNYGFDEKITNLIPIILFTKGCANNQLTCTNGQCVPKEARCNNIRECRDGSDEFSCGNVDFTFKCALNSLHIII